MHVNAHLEVRGQLLGVDSFLPPCGPWKLNWVVRLGNKYLYLLNHLAGPKIRKFESATVIEVKNQRRAMDVAQLSGCFPSTNRSLGFDPQHSVNNMLAHTYNLSTWRRWRQLYQFQSSLNYRRPHLKT